MDEGRKRVLAIVAGTRLYKLSGNELRPTPDFSTAC
jgi:hypothetical protein